ncbi:MAG: hypothetical protein LBQ84_08845 [Flavobacteriaceae bacterium]|jgi:hypothetical protein|nr:hypothetical protein [Flavobacteriaceae bacterium]
MKRFSLLLVFEIIISVVSGILMSRMSWLGRIGINLVRTEYKFFKFWWKTALVLFAIQITIILIQWMVKRFCNPKGSRLIFFLFLLLGIAGLGYTYYDFSTVYEHRIMKERFHLGVYLFWAGWVASNLYFLVTPYSRDNQVTE